MKKTHNNPLTPEQVTELLKNRYVKSATQNTVRFTEEFKRYFYQKHTSGMMVRSIFLECGIDPDVLGESRISGFCHTINKQAMRDPQFREELWFHHSSHPGVRGRQRHLHSASYRLGETLFLASFHSQQTRE